MMFWSSWTDFDVDDRFSNLTVERIPFGAMQLLIFGTLTNPPPKHVRVGCFFAFTSHCGAAAAEEGHRLLSGSD
jgi:hypothetical protein